jgi:hypothetical protein
MVQNAISQLHFRWKLSALVKVLVNGIATGETTPEIATSSPTFNARIVSSEIGVAISIMKKTQS